MQVNRAIVAVPLDGSAADGRRRRRRHPGPGHRRGVLRVPHPVAGRHASWRGSAGTTRGCRGTAPSCGSARSTGGAVTVADVDAGHGRPEESVLAPRWRDDDDPVRGLGRLRAGGTCTRWPRRPGRAAAAAPGGGGVRRAALAARRAAVRAARRRPAGGAARPRRAAARRSSTRRSGELTDVDLPGYRTATRSSPSPAPRSRTWPAARAPPGRCCGSSPDRRRRRSRSRCSPSSRSPPRPRLPAGRAPGAASAGRNGRVVHALVYPPANPGCTAPDGELPAVHRASCTAARPRTRCRCSAWRRRSSPAGASG